MEVGTKKRYNFISNLIFGAASGCISKTCVAPFDRIRVIMQTKNFNRTL